MQQQVQPANRFPPARKRLSTVMVLLIVSCPALLALDPSLEISQYGHTAWTVNQGAFKGVIYAFAQTPDGYLWLGTEFGVLRYDGVQFRPWEPPGNQLPSSYVRSLLVSRDGSVWIGTANGLARWQNGKLTQYEELNGQGVRALLERQDGVVWAGGTALRGKLCAFEAGKSNCYGDDGSLGSGVLSLYEDHLQNLWIGGADGLWRWWSGSPKPYPVPGTVPEVQGTTADWLPDQDAVRQLFGEDASKYRFLTNGQIVRALRDRDGGLWIGTKEYGLLHVWRGKIDHFSRANGLTAEYVSTLFEDREGNIWVATLSGLDRFRELAVSTITVDQGLSEELLGTVVADRNGSVWLGTFHGVDLWKAGAVTLYRNQHLAQPERRWSLPTPYTGVGFRDMPFGMVTPLLQDHNGRVWFSTARGILYFENGSLKNFDGPQPWGMVLSMAQDDAGDLWVDSQDFGLSHVVGDKVTEQFSWAALKHRDWALSLLIDRGELWLGFLDGGIARFQQGKIRQTYGKADGLGDGRVNAFHLDHERALWVATQGGLSRLKDGRITTMTTANGLPCNAIDWVDEDDLDSFWIETNCGLVSIKKPEMSKWAAASSSNRNVPVCLKVFDSSEGVLSHSRLGGVSPRVAKTIDGKLWFMPLNGVSVVDPRHLHTNPLPPPVHIEQVTVDR